MDLTEKGNPAMDQSLLNGGGHSAKITTGGVWPLLVKLDLSISFIFIHILTVRWF